jgi:hypothetical protein
LELRHQRTCDVLFDLFEKDGSAHGFGAKTKEYIYKMIETLLPKGKDENNPRLVEIFFDETQRDSWICLSPN